MKDKAFLFLCGCPRSGTSEITRILSYHPAFAIGMERYKHLRTAGRISELTPTAFTRETFFGPDLLEGARSEAARRVRHDFYEQLRAHFDEATYVGDKNPFYFRAYDHLLRTFPAVRIVFLLRDILPVAHSWKLRNEKRHGDAKISDFDQGVEVWNESISETLSLGRRSPGTLAVCDYDKLYSGDSAYYDRLLQWLEVEPHPKNDVYIARSMEKAANVRSKPRKFSPDEQQSIESNARTDLAAELQNDFGLETASRQVP